jgi:hypothetical protein
MVLVQEEMGRLRDAVDTLTKHKYLKDGTYTQRKILLLSRSRINHYEGGW